ncbi:MAG: NADP-dependent malic enzyme, partial [Muribaculaceae bacterium]|nr:NADP-dependent malic enzyme [Muribaculaceae bacterium]
VTFDQALEKMYDRNYFGMMMVETGDADAFVAGTYSGGHEAADIARSVIGIRDAYRHFASVHILNTKRGVYFLADTMINENADEDTLYDVARLARNTAEYYAREPVVALVSYSNFGSNSNSECSTVRRVVERLHADYPDLPVDGEMQVHYALNKDLRDTKYPFTRLKGKDENTFVFPNLSSANTTLRMILEMGVGEAIGPIQVGLKKPVHFINVDTDPRDIVNLVTIAVLDASVQQAVCAGESRYMDK